MSGKLLQLRNLRKRPTGLPADAAEPASVDPVARIDALTATGRANWLVLLGYLAFALITTLGVEDVDFFVASRQTQLPLVNVSIPTLSFFIFAPILGAALYTYLHLHIRKVTEELAEAPPAPLPLEERIRPWLVNDFVLRQRRDRDTAIRRRPMDWLAGLTTWFLVWAAGPIILGLMWIRTWPAHTLWLSLLCALCLMASLYAGALSWIKMRQDLGRRAACWTGIITGLIVLLAIPVAWLTTANSKGIGEYVIELPKDKQTPRSRIQRIEEWALQISTNPEASWRDHAGAWAWNRATGLAELDRPDMTDARLSVLPPDEADPDTARHRYRKGFCDRRGIGAEICDRAASPQYDPPAHLAAMRQKDWCDPRGYVFGAKPDCTEFFATLDAEFDREWSTYRKALIAALSKPDLSGKDLRRAWLARAKLAGINFQGAKMQGANLVGAEMQGVDLRWAEMQGADLSGAKMQGADLSGAEMQGANLIWAEMQEADLSGAKMQGADLSWAEMQEADLSGAKMQGANLVGAEMQGVDLRWAEMQEADLSGAEMQGADLSGAKMQGADLSGAKMQGANLVGAEMQGADLRSAVFKSAEWAGASATASPAHSADFRAGTDLTQALLSSLIGDGRTLLPDTPDRVWFIPSCWAAEPEGWDSLVATFAPKNDWRIFLRDTMSEDQMRQAFLCAPGEVPRKTGTPWPVDRAPPWEEDPNWQPEDRGPVDQTDPAPDTDAE